MYCRQAKLIQKFWLGLFFRIHNMVSNENRKIVYEENRGNDETGQTLRIIAFNDVYNIDEVKKGKGGAAR